MGLQIYACDSSGEYCNPRWYQAARARMRANWNRCAAIPKPRLMIR